MQIYETTIFSIGHGNRKIEDFIFLLNEHEVEFVIDVRSKPRSRFHPHFNKDTLELHLRNHGIKYVFMGHLLGGIPSDKTCYDDDGHVNYEKIKTKDFFLEGINRIKTAYEKKIKVACMCSELEPCDCHRSKLIGEALKDKNIEILHIGKKGDIKNQKDIMNEILGSRSLDLFSDEKMSLKSRKSYLK
ncbi:DUF488 domain-containing protein [Rahnella aceris]